MNLRPTRGKLIGEIMDGDYQTDSGIYVVTSSKTNKKPRRVRVLAIGGPFEDSKGRPQSYRAAPGQIAFIKLSEGVRVTIERKKLLVIENDDIVAVSE